MNTLPIETSSSVFVDMYIGPVFDAERYLDLERQLFKVEPRPIPGCERSKTQRRSTSSIFDKFIDGATKFSWWLDDALKAPFRAISSMSKSSSQKQSESVGNGIQSEDEGTRITPPPRVYKPKHMESRRLSRATGSRRVTRSDEPKYGNKVTMSKASQKKVGVTRRGHVQELIKKFEELSDVSLECSTGPTRTRSRSATSAPEPGRTGKTNSVPVAMQRHMKEGGHDRQKIVVPKTVSKPPKVATPSMLMKRRNEKRGEVKSGGNVNLSEQDKFNELEVGDTNNDPSGGNVARHNVGHGGRGRKSDRV